MRKLGAPVLLLFCLAILALPGISSAARLPLNATPSPIAFPKTTVNGPGSNLAVELENPGSEVTIAGVSLSGLDSSQFAVNGSGCTGPLAEGQKCTVQVSFSPSSAGPKLAEMSVALFSEPSEVFPLSGQAVEPELGFSPTGHDFGLQPVNRDGTSFAFQVENTGEASVQPSNIEIQGGDGSFSRNFDSCSGPLGPGQSCSVEVGFRPQDRVAYSGELRVSANGASFGAALAGEGGRAEVSADGPALFGAAQVGSVGSMRTITLTNSGNLAAGFFIAIVAGGDSGSFQLLSENCTFVELQPGASCTAQVRFAPQAAGSKVARLALFGDDGNGAGALLEGEGTPVPASSAQGAATAGLPRVRFDSGFDFRPTVRGRSSRFHSFALANLGSVPVVLDRAAIVGANLDQFRLIGDECSGETLLPGQECLFRVRFAPRTVGAKTAKLRVWGDGGAVYTAALGGKGEPRPEPRRGHGAPMTPSR